MGSATTGSPAHSKDYSNEWQGEQPENNTHEPNGPFCLGKYSCYLYYCHTVTQASLPATRLLPWPCAAVVYHNAGNFAAVVNVAKNGSSRV